MNEIETLRKIWAAIDKGCLIILNTEPEITPEAIRAGPKKSERVDIGSEMIYNAD